MTGDNVLTPEAVLMERLQQLERTLTARIAELELALAAKDDVQETKHLQVSESAQISQKLDVGGDLTAHGTVDAAAIKVANTLEASTVQVGQTLSVGGNLAVKGTIEAAAVTKAGIPINLSQWATGAKGISYSGGSVGIGTGAPEGKLDVRGEICAGNSDLYFTQTGHRHTGRGNAPGQAAIENAVDHNALMILGRSGAPQGRAVKLWDYLQVNGTLDVTGRINGQLSGLDVAPNFSAVVRCADFLIGGVGDRGPERRAMVAWPNTLVVNHNTEWPECIVFGFRAGSTREHKHQIEHMELPEAKDLLQSLAPVEFAYRSDEEGRRCCGFIAEETPQVLASRDQKAICLDGILAVLTKVVQAQEQEIGTLRTEVARLSRQAA